MKNFDELFNDFLGNEKPKRRPKKIDKIPDDRKDGLKALLDLISELSSSEDFDVKFGPARDVNRYTDEYGVTFEERTWDTEHGEITRTELIHPTSPEEEYKVSNVSLEDRLNKAIANEEYELAAILRDQIKNN